MNYPQVGSAVLHAGVLGRNDLTAIGRLIRDTINPYAADSPLRRVLNGKEVSRNVLLAQLPEGRLAQFCSCGLLVEHGQRIFSPFRAHLVEEFVIVTDPDAPQDLHDPLYLDPLCEAPQLAKLLIREAASRGLDMGCGCGVLSLVVSTFCEEVIGVDINPRAIEFSRFNAALNEVRNVAFMESDLFDAVRGQQFDLVVFNSPTNEEGYEYRDLLESGEPLLTRFFTDLANHLTPSGYCQINLAMNDYSDSRFSDRLAGWIRAGKHDLRWVAMVCKRFRRDDQIWKRGWATFCRGPHFSAEVDWPYGLLPSALLPEELSQLVLRLLENHELLNSGRHLPHLTWSEGVCSVPPHSQTLGLWDVPLAEVPEELLFSLRSHGPLSFPAGSRLDSWIEVCLRKGLLRVPHEVSTE